MYKALILLRDIQGQRNLESESQVNSDPVLSSTDRIATVARSAMADMGDYLEKRASTASVSHDGDEVPLERTESKQSMQSTSSEPDSEWKLMNPSILDSPCERS